MSAKEQQKYEKMKDKLDSLKSNLNRLQFKSDKYNKNANKKAADKINQKMKEQQNLLVEVMIQMADLAAQAGENLDYYNLAMLYSEKESFSGSGFSFRGNIHSDVKIPKNLDLKKEYPFWEISEQKAFHYLQICSKGGGSLAVYAKEDMLDYYATGRGMPVCMVKYAELLTELVEIHRQKSRALELADLYYQGENGIEKNYERAAHFYMIAARELSSFPNRNVFYPSEKNNLDTIAEKMEVIRDSEDIYEANVFIELYNEWLKHYNEWLINYNKQNAERIKMEEEEQSKQAKIREEERKIKEVREQIRKEVSKTEAAKNDAVKGLDEIYSFRSLELGENFYRRDEKGRRVDLDKYGRDKPLQLVAAYKKIKDQKDRIWTFVDRYDTFVVYRCDSTGEVIKIRTEDIVDLDDIRGKGITTSEYHFYYRPWSELE